MKLFQKKFSTALDMKKPAMDMLFFQSSTKDRMTNFDIIVIVKCYLAR